MKPIFIFFILFSNLLIAQPVINSVSGTFSNRDTVTINGFNFGTKSSTKPLIWADFENGIQPSNLGSLTSWADYSGVNSGATNPHSGTRCAESADLSTIEIFDVEVLTPSISYSQKYYVSFWRRVTYTEQQASLNLKWFRIWRYYNNDIHLPDTYIGQPYNGWRMFYTEGCDYQLNLTNFWAYPGSTWRFEEYVYQMSSGDNNGDGIFRLYINGQNAGSTTNWISSCSVGSGISNYICIQEDVSNASYPQGTKAYFDDIYIDQSWSRVLIGNSTNLSTSNHLEMQIPIYWSDNSITLVVNKGAFDDNDLVYIFVIDQNGNVNNLGFPIQIGSIPGQSPSKPLNLKVTP